ncbi:MAG: anti-sigma factor domain-containing protein, partial [Nocardioides sp.]
MSDIHELSGAYVVDALDDAERIRFERHLMRCPECLSEVAELRETAALLAEDAPVEPPGRLRGKVLDAITTVRPLPPLVDERPDRIDAPPPVRAEPAGQSAGVTVPATEEATVRTGRARRRRWPLLVAAAAAVAAAGVGSAVVWQPWDRDNVQVSEAAGRVLDAGDAMSATSVLAEGGEVTLVRSERLGQAVFVLDDAPAAPEGRTYQMWLFADSGAVVSAGLIESGG